MSQQPGRPGNQSNFSRASQKKSNPVVLSSMDPKMRTSTIGGNMTVPGTNKTILEHNRDRRNTKATPLQPETQQVLMDLIEMIGKLELECESQRQLIASIPEADPYSMFRRIDRDNDGFIKSIEMLAFLRENKCNQFNEADCYYLINFYETAGGDTVLSYGEFLQIILPNDNSLLRAITSQKGCTYYLEEPSARLPLELEFELAILLAMEIELNRQTEPLKQELRCAKDFSEDSAIACLDTINYGFIDSKNIKQVFVANKRLIADEYCMGLIRRFETDGVPRLTHAEFISGLAPLEPYSKVLVKEKVEQRKQLQEMKEKIKLEQKEFEAKMKAAKEAKEGGKEEVKQKKQVKVQDSKNDMLTQVFEKNIQSQEMLGMCPLKFRPIITVQEDKPKKAGTSGTGGSKKTMSISSKKPPLIANNNDIGNLQQPQLSVIRESEHSSYKSKQSNLNKKRSTSSLPKPQDIPQIQKSASLKGTENSKNHSSSHRGEVERPPLTPIQPNTNAQVQPQPDGQSHNRRNSATGSATQQRRNSFGKVSSQKSGGSKKSKKSQGGGAANVLGNLLIGKLKKGILSKIGGNHEYSPGFKSKLKQMMAKKNSEQIPKPIEKPQFLSEGGSNPFSRLLQARPNKALTEISNDDDDQANPMAGLFSGILGGGTDSKEDQTTPQMSLGEALKAAKLAKQAEQAKAKQQESKPQQLLDYVDKQLDLSKKEEPQKSQNIEEELRQAKLAKQAEEETKLKEQTEAKPTLPEALKAAKLAKQAETLMLQEQLQALKVQENQDSLRISKVTQEEKKLPFIPPLKLPRSPDRVRSALDERENESISSSQKLQTSTPKKRLIPRESSQQRSNHSISHGKVSSISMDRSIQNDVAILQLKSTRQAAEKVMDLLGQANVDPSNMIVAIFRYQIDLDNQIDSIKKSLAQKPDFNLIDAFKFFDHENKGWVNSLDFYNGLLGIGVKATTADIMYFVKKYDRNETGRLKYSDFCDALIPLETQSAKILCKRQPKGGESFFSSETFDLFKVFWQTYFGNELLFDEIRHSLKLSNKYDPQGWFNACDTQQDGFMDADDIRNLFSKVGGIRESDIQILVDRYDTKAERDGQISFSEFLSQLRGRLTAQPENQ